MTADEFVALLDGVRSTRDGWTARCPSHEDRHASLSIAEGDDGCVLVYCFAGCTADKVTAALGLQLRDLFAREQAPIVWRPQTAEERQAARVRRLDRKVRALELEQKRLWRMLANAGLIISALTTSTPDAVVAQLWNDAVEELEREAAAAADEHARQT